MEQGFGVCDKVPDPLPKKRLSTTSGTWSKSGGYKYCTIKSTDIVILALSPVSQSKASSVTGFKKVDSYNAALKSVAKSCNVRFYDYTSYNKDSSGYLKSAYNGGDRIHWNVTGYKKFAQIISAYDKKLEKSLVE